MGTRCDAYADPSASKPPSSLDFSSFLNLKNPSVFFSRIKQKHIRKIRNPRFQSSGSFTYPCTRTVILKCS
ncbi:hypothetical protein AAC387_Pa06g2031 [Persea americana]